MCAASLRLEVSESIRDMALAKFWQRVEAGDVNDCWEWKGHLNNCGYGVLRVDTRKTVLAHRLSWALFKSFIPDGLSVCHHCDNRRCANPAHLFLGTNADNLADMRAKGRQGNPIHHGLLGSASPNAQLDEMQVLLIRLGRKLGVRVSQIARIYGMRPSNASRIISGERWPHVPVL